MKPKTHGVHLNVFKSVESRGFAFSVAITESNDSGIMFMPTTSTFKYILISKRSCTLFYSLALSFLIKQIN